MRAWASRKNRERVVAGGWVWRVEDGRRKMLACGSPPSPPPRAGRAARSRLRRVPSQALAALVLALETLWHARPVGVRIANSPIRTKPVSLLDPTTALRYSRREGAAVVGPRRRPTGSADGNAYATERIPPRPRGGGSRCARQMKGGALPPLSNFHPRWARRAPAQAGWARPGL